MRRTASSMVQDESAHLAVCAHGVRGCEYTDGVGALDTHVALCLQHATAAVADAKQAGASEESMLVQPPALDEVRDALEQADVELLEGAVVAVPAARRQKTAASSGAADASAKPQLADCWKDPQKVAAALLSAPLATPAEILADEGALLKQLPGTNPKVDCTNVGDSCLKTAIFVRFGQFTRDTCSFTVGGSDFTTKLDANTEYSIIKNKGYTCKISNYSKLGSRSRNVAMLNIS